MRLLITLLISSCLMGSAFAQTTTQDTSYQRQEYMQTDHKLPPEAMRAAETMLSALQKFITADNFEQMGFRSADEVKMAQLANPLPVRMVELEDLRHFNEGIDPNALLHDIRKVMVTVQVNGETRSSVDIEQNQSGWKGTGFGAPHLSKSIAEATRISMSQTQLPSQAYFIVHVAALNNYFVGHHRDNRLMLTSVTDNQMADVRAGQTLPAKDVFTRLVPLAKQYNGLPL